jgi:hypothetical protein
MRLYTKEDFEDELRQLGLIKTDHEENTLESCRMWVDSEGHFFPVPEFPAGKPYPDYILDRLISSLEKISQRKHFDE